MEKNAENYLREKYREVFNNLEVEIQSAGKDLTEYFKNGAFWGTGKVAKHMLGASGVYETYAFTIIEDSLASVYKKITAAKEGCGYALGKGNIEQFFRFLLYGADLQQENTLINELAYKYACYVVKEKKYPQKWFYAYADVACEVAFSEKINEEYSEFHSRVIACCAELYNGHDNSIYLYLLGLAYYGNPEEKRFIDDCRKKCVQDTYFKNEFNKAQKKWIKYGFYQNI